MSKVSRFTVFACWDGRAKGKPAPDCYSIEEIDVDAKNETEARKLARAELDRHYKPNARIFRVVRRAPGVLYL